MTISSRDWGPVVLRIFRHYLRQPSAANHTLAQLSSGRSHAPVAGFIADQIDACIQPAVRGWHGVAVDAGTKQSSLWGHERWSSRLHVRGAKSDAGGGRERGGRAGSSKKGLKGGAAGKVGESAVAADEQGLLVEKEEAEESPLYAASENPTKLTKEDVNKFYKLSSEVRARKFPEGLPKGVFQELKATSSSRLMLREHALKLIWEVEASLAEKGALPKDGLTYYSEVKGRKPRPSLMLAGPAGCGKSVILTTLVHWARAAGWLVVYLPSAQAFTDGGIYKKHQASGLWDTPWQARDFLKRLLAVHAHELDLLPLRIPADQLGPEYGGTAALTPSERIRLGTALVKDSGTLKELAERGLADDGASAADVAVRLRAELAAQTNLPLLIVVDDYNTWLTHSNYDVNTSERSTAPIPAWNLRFVRAWWQVHDLARGVFVGALSETLGVPSERTCKQPAAPFRMERFSEQELGAILTYYHSRGVISSPASAATIKKLFHMTNGNGAEVRQLAEIFTEMDRPDEREDEETLQLAMSFQKEVASNRLQSGFL